MHRLISDNKPAAVAMVALLLLLGAAALSGTAIAGASGGDDASEASGDNASKEPARMIERTVIVKEDDQANIQGAGRALLGILLPRVLPSKVPLSKVEAYGAMIGTMIGVTTGTMAVATIEAMTIGTMTPRRMTSGKMTTRTTTQGMIWTTSLR